MAINSRLAYLQPGDGAAAYDNPHYRRLVENAMRWVAGVAGAATPALSERSSRHRPPFRRR
jgi:type 1 glutamine amidotransferase